MVGILEPKRSEAQHGKMEGLFIVSERYTRNRNAMRRTFRVPSVTCLGTRAGSAYAYIDTGGLYCREERNGRCVK